MKRMGLVALCVAVGGCGGTSLTPAESDSLDATVSHQQSLAISDELFNYDPTLNPAVSAEANAQAIASRAMTTMPCASVTLSGATVTVTAPSTGCSVADGVTFSGTVTATVSESGSDLTVVLTFTDFVLSGNAVSGTLTFVTMDGFTLQITCALVRNGKPLSGTLTAVGAPGQITTSGALTHGAATVTLTAVVWQKGQCYPGAGTISLQEGKVTTVYTFDSATATTGVLTDERGKTVQLPAYGSCPGSPDAGP
jgi:hypothetical protein